MPIPVTTTILLAAASLLLILRRSFSRSRRGLQGAFFFIVLLLTGYMELAERSAIDRPAEDTTAYTVWTNDELAHSEHWLVLAFGCFAGCAVYGAESREHQTSGIYGFLLFLIAGMWIVAQSNDFLSLGLALEIVNLALAGLRRRVENPSSQIPKSPIDSRTNAPREVWVFWLSSALMWFGIAILTNTLATTNFEGLHRVLMDAYGSQNDQTMIGAPSKLILLAVALIVMSLLARMGFVPFHHGILATASRYSLPSLGFLIFAEQFVGSLVLTRLLGCVFVGLSRPLSTLLMSLVLVNTAVSSAIAVRALIPGVKSIPRWISSLILLQNVWFGIGLMVVVTELDYPRFRYGAFANQYESLAVLVFSQFTGLLAGCGLCVILGNLVRDDRQFEFVEDLKGLWKSAPMTSLALTVILGSLLGIPVTAGFWSRWLTLLAGSNIHLKSVSAVFLPSEGLRIVMAAAIVAVLLNTVVFVRLLREMFLESPLARPVSVGGRSPFVASMIVATICLLIGIIAPQIALTPLRSIHPPLSVKPEPAQTGSGRTPVGLNAE